MRLFVADEVHLVGDAYRGPTLETLLTKIIVLAPKAQVLALSATIRNAKELAKWLKSRLVDVEWRPVRLIEGVYLYGEIYFSDNSKKKVDSTNRGLPIDVATETVKDGGQSLIFTETRRRSVSLALKASEVVPKYLTKPEKKQAASLAKEIISTGEETELSRRLARAVEHGVAFHHAGLNMKHRRLVEENFKNGLVKLLTATPTLAAGVNLPARRVVLSSLYRYDSEYGGPVPISVLDYKQMCGRAGRPKFDTEGETVLLTRSEEEADDVYMRYVKGKPEPITSQLSRSGALRTHVLATIATLPGMTQSEIYSLFSKTLFANQFRQAAVKIKMDKALDFLTSELLVERRGQRFLATEFGKRVSMLYIDPATGIEFRHAVKYAEERASQLTGLLHIIASAPDFTPRLPLRRGDREEAGLFLEEHEDEFIIPVPEEDDYEAYEDFIQSFRILGTMLSWIDESPEEKILERHNAQPGDLHRAVESADWLLYALAEVCKIVGRASLLRDIDNLRRRVKYGVRAELIPLTTLEGVGRIRARTLYNAGYRELRKLKAASTQRIAEVPKIGLAVAKKIKRQLNR